MLDLFCTYFTLEDFHGTIQVFFQANVVCRELGFNAGALQAYGYSRFGPVPDTFSYANVVCAGTESRFDDCPHTNEVFCPARNGAGVLCNNSNVPGKTSLMNIM